jgi:hypothetical protein
VEGHRVTITEEPLTKSTAANPGTRTPAASAAVKPVRTRRSAIWIGGAAALILLGFITGYFIYTSASNSTQVWIAKAPIARGHTIAQDDITPMSITAGQTTKAIPQAKLDEVLGKTAIVDIPSGGLITTTSIASQLGVPAGKAVVGLTLVPGRLPAQPLKVGDNIVIVPVPAQGGQALPVSATDTIPATVSQVRPVPNTNNVVVDVFVNVQNAPDVTSKGAAGAVAIYLASQGDK